MEDSPDPLSLFHRHIQPFFEKHGKGLPILIDDSGSERRIKTRDLKQLARLDILRGVCVTAQPAVAGNYLKGARHYKARHEFGVFLGNAEQIFSLFKPAGGVLGGLQERWQRLWLGAEMPHGIAPLSASLFPRAWRQAWNAAVAGDAPRMLAFQEAFKNLAVPFDPMACVRAALAEEGVLSSDLGLPGSPRLDDAQRGEWLFEYFSTKKELGRLLKEAPQPAAPRAAEQGAQAPARQPAPWDVVGIGGVVLDEFHRVGKIVGAEAKGQTQGRPERRPGGVMLNQLSWAASLGMKSAAFGFVGADADGDWLRSELRLRGVDDAGLRPGSQSSDISHIFVDAKGARAIYLEPGAVTASSARELSQFEALISGAKLLSTEISLLPLEAVEAAMALAKKHTACRWPWTWISRLPRPRPSPDWARSAQLQRLLKGADYLKTSVAFARELAPKARPAALALALHKKYAKKKGAWVALTDGAKGCQLSDGVRTLKIPALKGLRVIDSTGCGDAFMAGMLAATRLGLSLEEAGRLANACGAACATSLGAAAPAEGARASIARLYKGPGLSLEALGPLGGAEEQGQAFVAKALRSFRSFPAKSQAGTWPGPGPYPQG